MRTSAGRVFAIATIVCCGLALTAAIRAGTFVEIEPNDAAPNVVPFGDTLIIGSVADNSDRDRFTLRPDSGVTVTFESDLPASIPGAGYVAPRGCGADDTGVYCNVDVYYRYPLPDPPYVGAHDYAVTLRYGSLDIEPDAAVVSLIGDYNLTNYEFTWLDLFGNANGYYDLGDFRALLDRHGELTGEP